jgi:hypothetical protein
LRSGNYKQALLAIARNNHLALVAAFERAIEALKQQAVFGLVLPVARQARSLEERLNVLVKGQVLLIGGRGQFADIYPADVPMVVLRHSRQSGQGHSKQYRCGGSVHIGCELVTSRRGNASKTFQFDPRI